MLVAVIVLACTVVSLVGVQLVMLKDRARAGADWVLERRELLNRIQRPDMVPVTASTQFRVPEPEPDDLELVGTIHYTDTTGA